MRAVVFDLDGTLSDTAPTERWKNLGCRALRQTGINILLEMEQRS